MKDRHTSQYPEQEQSLSVKRCSSCLSLAYADDRYCARCGSSLFLTCPICNTEIRHPVAFFCTNCGTSLSD